MVALIAPVELSVESRDVRRRRYREAWPSTPVDVRNLTAAGPLPARLNSPDDIERLSAAFAELFDRTAEHVIPDCMLDPGLEHVADDRHVRGLFHLITRELRRTGRRVALVSRNAAMRDRMRWLVQRYGAGDVCAASHDLDIAPADAFDAKTWSAAIGALRAAGENADVLACCTGVAFDADAAAELRILTPYDLIPAIEEEVGRWTADEENKERTASS